ncbi:hypothetical protein [Paenibacillus piri]|uniref:Uncharacterized protein n=1 Tax=Paenibacillus piri TaxID=2547395 RepID=A0A4R5KK25_9BACL|nr:hypothetical protein [Paenibacillus piri]TDF95502.1 hypothetical protein E1757_20615 [Paenibacillus piri]
MENHLNWSFDYRSHHVPTVDFYTKFNQMIEEKKPEPGVIHYAIMPNYSFNHFPGICNMDELLLGELRIERRKKADGWSYHVRQKDSSSGEALELSFSCEDNHFRSLKDRFELSASIQSNDLFKSYSLRGQIFRESDRADVKLLHSSGTSFSAGQAPLSQPLISEFTLFDTLPVLAGQGGVQEFALLERLERLYPHQRLGHLQEDILSSGTKKMRIQGYYLHGTGTIPSYWWVDEQQRVVVMTTTLFTYVLRDQEGIKP